MLLLPGTVDIQAQATVVTQEHLALVVTQALPGIPGTVDIQALLAHLLIFTINGTQVQLLLPMDS